MKNKNNISYALFQFPLIAVLASSLVAVANAAPGQPPSFSRESIEWCDIWIPHANETKLPRVLLIGDSISRDYYPGVEKRLAGKAYVDRLSTSAFISDPVLLQEIKMVLGAYKFDVILFNNGTHGWQHSEKEYEKAFPKFLNTIREYAPDAKLIWANTTPLKNDSAAESVEPTSAVGKGVDTGKLMLKKDLMVASDERIAARNAIALRFVQVAGIPVVDLNALVRGHPEYHTDNVHFDSEGINLEAAQVAAAIEKQLNP